MGGLGSTRWEGYRRKLAAEDCPQFDIRELYEALDAGRRGRVELWDLRSVELVLDPAAGQGRVILTNGQALTLTTTPVHFGGVRWWWVCGCGRRCRCVFQPSGMPRYVCRICAGLSYRSQQRSRYQLKTTFDLPSIRAERARLLEALTAAPGTREYLHSLKRLFKVQRRLATGISQKGL